MVTWENYEEYMVLHVDGALSEAEEKALLAFIDQHPELRDELRLYEATVLKPDTTLVYSDKEALLKPEGGTSIPLRQWWMYGAAAGLLLLVGMTAYRTLLSHKSPVIENHSIAQKVPVSEKPVSREEATVNEAHEQEKLPANQPMIRRKEGGYVAAHGVHSNTNARPATTASFPTMELTPIQPLVREVTEVPVLTAQLSPLEITPSVEHYEFVAERTQPDILAWLPEEKQEGLQTLKENIDQRIVKAKHLKDQLKDSQLALRIGSRELFVINF
mgnify:CR=1 FL=1